ncbi:MAG: MBOAT family protein, partial [Flavobacteriales bacterium]|nr:MBOAT family protein [Flavobacteriales bacterium]
MLFDTFEFSIFLPIVFILYWIIPNKNISLQNCFLIVTSYIFYGWWNWQLVPLIAISTLIDYAVGLLLLSNSNAIERRILVSISVFSNLGLLAFFKYHNFFIDSFVDSFSLFGSNLEMNSLEIILPVGISFYTFQTMSYTLDVFKKKLNPTKNLSSFAAFVCFFPQLVAGPIERATHFLPQFQNKRIFNYDSAADGLRQILWG